MMMKNCMGTLESRSYTFTDTRFQMKPYSNSCPQCEIAVKFSLVDNVIFFCLCSFFALFFFVNSSFTLIPLPPSFRLPLSVDRHRRVREEPPAVSWGNLSEHRGELWLWMSYRPLAQQRWLCLWRLVTYDVSHSTFTHSCICIHTQAHWRLCIILSTFKSVFSLAQVTSQVMCKFKTWWMNINPFCS